MIAQMTCRLQTNPPDLQLDLLVTKLDCADLEIDAWRRSRPDQSAFVGMHILHRSAMTKHSGQCSRSEDAGKIGGAYQHQHKRARPAICGEYASPRPQKRRHVSGLLTNRRNKSRVEGIVREPEKYRRLSHTAVANQQQLEQVVICLRHRSVDTWSPRTVGWKRPS